MQLIWQLVHLYLVVRKEVVWETPWVFPPSPLPRIPILYRTICSCLVITFIMSVYTGIHGHIIFDLKAVSIF